MNVDRRRFSRFLSKGTEYRLLFFVCACAVGTLNAQPRVASTERLSLPAGQSWSNAHFSRDGKALFLSGSNYGSIWKYDLNTKALKQIVTAAGAGYGFTLSSDNLFLGYRTTTTDPVSRRRTYSARVLDLLTGKSTVLSSGRDVGIPVVMRGGAVTLDRGSIAKSTPELSASETEVLGISNTKIVLLVGGERVVLDPFGNGSYIWPSLSPDKTKIVAYELGRGTFVCDLKGTILATMGRKDAPSWTRDGKWIVYMNDRDDGERLLSSTIAWASADGAQNGELLQDPGLTLMNPHCSPVENKIACDTPEGDIVVISYEEGGR